MVADEIITIAVEADASRTVQPLAKLAVKDQKAQALAIDQVFQRLRHAGSKLVRGSERVFAAVLQHCRWWHA